MPFYQRSNPPLEMTKCGQGLTCHYQGVPFLRRFPRIIGHVERYSSSILTLDHKIYHKQDTFGRLRVCGVSHRLTVQIATSCPLQAFTPPASMLSPLFFLIAFLKRVTYLENCRKLPNEVHVISVLIMPRSNASGEPSSSGLPRLDELSLDCLASHPHLICSLQGLPEELVLRLFEVSLSPKKLPLCPPSPSLCCNTFKQKSLNSLSVNACRLL